MPLPSITEYRNALQNPSIAIPWAGEVEVARDRMGLPMVHAGNFAAAFRLRQRGEPWTLRCFHREIPDLEARVKSYQAFQQAIVGELKACLLPEGLHTIQVSGAGHPVVSMPWIEGDGLRKWIAEHRRDHAALRRMRTTLVGVFGLMEAAGAVHGDLQTGNILVRPGGAIALLDYDSFTSRNGSVRDPGNQGHPGFQHPAYDSRRDGPHADKLPMLILCLALDGLACRPQLWDMYGEQAEGLLFEPSDLRRPTDSSLLKTLRTEPSMAPWVDWLEELLRRDPAGLPGLQQLLSPPSPRPMMSFGKPAPRPHFEQLISKRVHGQGSGSCPPPIPSPLPAIPPHPAPAPQGIPAPPNPPRHRLHPLAAGLLLLAGGMVAFAGRAAVQLLGKPGPAPARITREAPPRKAIEMTQAQIRAGLSMSAVLAGSSPKQEAALLAAFDREVGRSGADPAELKSRLASIPGAPRDWAAWLQEIGFTDITR